MNAKFKHSVATIIIALLTITQAMAASDEIMLKKLREKYPATKISEVNLSSINGIYEVVMGKNIAYTDASARFFIFGNLFDMVAQTDMTATRKENMHRVSWPKSHLANAIKIVKGTGERKLAVFSDPDCAYCKKIEASLQRIDNLTLYVFLYPVDRLHPQAREKSISIWCHQNQVSAWRDWMLSGKEPTLRACLNPIHDNIALAAQYQIQGTPTLIAEDGRVLAGAASATKIEAWLATTKNSQGGKP